MRQAKRSLLALLVCALGAASLASPASAAFEFTQLSASFEEADGSATVQAGSHPHGFVTEFAFATKVDPELELPFEVPDGSPRDLIVTAPPGLAGNPTATERCTTLQFSTGLGGECSPNTQVGLTKVTFDQPTSSALSPVYNLTPPPGVAAKLGFYVSAVPITIEAGVNPLPPYNILAALKNIPQVLPVYGAKTTIFGKPGGPKDPPFLTAPRACEGPLASVFEARSWEQPQNWIEGEALSSGLQHCSKLLFAPQLSAEPTSKAASAPSGIDIELTIEDEGISNPDGVADSDIKKAVVTLPEGMTANPALAEGLETCSPTAYAKEALGTQGCPPAAKIGTVQAETPLLEDELLKGNLYIAAQNENPFNSLLALYMVIKDPGLGILVKLAGKVTPDPDTGQLTTSFGEPGHELPQFPLSRVNVHLREGGRSPLITPSACGTYETEATFTPWANPEDPLITSATMQISEGVNGGDCPAPGTPPFDPGFEAGSINNRAGGFSPFLMRLTRSDGDQDLTRFSATLPPGMVAKLTGTTFCPDSAIAAAKSKSGKAEQADPSCPDSSQIGSVSGGAGVGAQLIFVPGEIYLAGPHNGAPLSVIAIVPAVAGPFDVGNVVVRQALRVNPRTGIVSADGASSDPLPHILAGIPLRVRDIRVAVDKPNFTLNPTSCEPSQVAAQIFGGGANVFSSLDDSPLSRSARFQAADCAALGFKPRLDLRLKGATKRGGHPALKGTYRPRAGDANLEGLVLRLPRSAFLDQAHIRTICTRVQFAAGGGNGAGCPAGAVYGFAKAFTPILDQPLQGPVFLRSSDNNLPDFVAALEGLVDVEAVARIDSVRGGIRASFEEVPDAPLTKVEVAMGGGKKGLIVNSTDLCAAKSRANAQMAGHNGRRAKGRPVVKASCGKARGAKRAQKRQRR